GCRGIARSAAASCWRGGGPPASPAPPACRGGQSPNTPPGVKQKAFFIRRPPGVGGDKTPPLGGGGGPGGLFKVEVGGKRTACTDARPVGMESPQGMVKTLVFSRAAHLSRKIHFAETSGSLKDITPSRQN